MKYRLNQRFLVAALFPLLLPGSGIAQEGSQSLSQIMKQSYESLTYMVTASLDGESGDNPDFTAALKQLEAASLGISEHTNALPYSFDPVTRSLEDSVGQMIQAYGEGLTSIGDSYLVETMSHCATCHMQSPDLGSALNVDAFVNRIIEEEFDTALTAQMLIAVRRIPDALQLWENRLLDESFVVADQSAELVILEYISSVAHLNSDPGTAITLLKKIAERENNSYYLPRKITRWVRQLELYQTVSNGQLTLDTIDLTLDRCRTLERSPLAGNNVVCNIIGSALSSRMLRQTKVLNPEVEGTLYLNIGVYRMNTGLVSIAVPRIEIFLEAAILTSPGSETAKTAYAHLEELAYLIYGDIELADEVMDISIEGLKKAALY